MEVVRVDAETEETDEMVLKVATAELNELPEAEVTTAVDTEVDVEADAELLVGTDKLTFDVRDEMLEAVGDEL